MPAVNAAGNVTDHASTDPQLEAAVALTLMNVDGAWQAARAAGFAPDMLHDDLPHRIVRAVAAVAARGDAITPCAVSAEMDGRPIPGWNARDLVRTVAEVPALVQRTRQLWEQRRLADFAALVADGKLTTFDAARTHLAQLDAAARTRPDWLPDSLISGGKLLDARYEPVAFAITPYFPRGEITELVGAHGIFKSTAALGACLSVAAGCRWGGAEVAQGKAVFVTMEDSERALAQRTRAWLEGIPAGRERSDAAHAVRESFYFLAREQARALALTHTDKTVTVPRTPVIERVAQLVQGAGLVVLETASRLHDGPEANEALAVFAQAIEDIAGRTGAALCIVRHVSKQAARERFVDSYVGRGGGALSDAARSVLVMTRERASDDEDGESDPFAPVRLVHTKSTHTAAGAPITWKPTACEHGVYLHNVAAAEEIRDDANRLHRHLVALGDQGITQKDLHNGHPAGLKRAAAQRAMDLLVASGRAIRTSEARGKTNQQAVVYRRAPEPPACLL